MRISLVVASWLAATVLAVVALLLCITILLLPLGLPLLSVSLRLYGYGARQLMPKSIRKPAHLRKKLGKQADHLKRKARKLG